MVQCNFIQQIRQYKIFGMAIFDWISTFLAGLLLTYLLDKYVFIKNNFWELYVWTMIFLIILAIFVHKIMGVDTMLNYYLGLNPKPLQTICN